MRLTVDLINGSPFYMNPLKERELDLRGNEITVIENLGVTNDGFDAIDLTDNEITRLENFPLLKRLTTLLLANNRITHISTTLGEQLPNLRVLSLANNRLTTAQDIEALVGLKRLEHLSLVDNPITKLPNYRLFVIHTLPQVRVLDGFKVRQKERHDAEKLFGNSSSSTSTSTSTSM